MVPKTSDDLPDPETPVKTVRRRLGISTLTSFRLFTRAPWTRIRSWRSARWLVELILAIGSSGSGLRSLRAFGVEGDRFANQRLEGGWVDPVSLVEIDRAADLAVEPGIEEAGRVRQRGTLGEGQLHVILI